MSAQAAFLNVLSDETLTFESLQPKALSVARAHHMGLAALAKVCEKLGCPEKPDQTVEEAICRIAGWIRENRENQGKTKTPVIEDIAGASSKEACFPDHEVENGDDEAMTEAEARSVVPPTQPRTRTSSSETDAPRPRSSRYATSDEHGNNSPLDQPANSELKEGSCQASLVTPGFTANDVGKLFSAFNELKATIASLSIEAADREVRHARQVKDLSKKVDHLQCTLASVQETAKNTEQRLLSKLADVKSELQHQSTFPKLPSGPSKEPGQQATSTPPKQMQGKISGSSENDNSRPPKFNHQAQPTRTENNFREQPPAEQQEVSPESNTIPNPWIQPKSRHQLHTNTESFRARPKLPRLENKLMGTTRVKRCVFYLGGIDTSCSIEAVTDFCDNRNVRISSCRFLQSKVFGTKSARLSVSSEDAKAANIMSKDFWPDNITIRPWNFPSSDSNDQ